MHIIQLFISLGISLINSLSINFQSHPFALNIPMKSRRCTFNHNFVTFVLLCVFFPPLQPANQGHHYQREMNPLRQSNPR